MAPIMLYPIEFSSLLTKRARSEVGVPQLAFSRCPDPLSHTLTTFKSNLDLPHSGIVCRWQTCQTSDTRHFHVYPIQTPTFTTRLSWQRAPTKQQCPWWGCYSTKVHSHTHFPIQELMKAYHETRAEDCEQHINAVVHESAKKTYAQKQIELREAADHNDCSRKYNPFEEEILWYEDERLEEEIEGMEIEDLEKDVIEASEIATSIAGIVAKANRLPPPLPPRKRAIPQTQLTASEESIASVEITSPRNKRETTATLRSAAAAEPKSLATPNASPENPFEDPPANEPPSPPANQVERISSILRKGTLQRLQITCPDVALEGKQLETQSPIDDPSELYLEYEDFGRRCSTVYVRGENGYWTECKEGSEVKGVGEI